MTIERYNEVAQMIERGQTLLDEEGPPLVVRSLREAMKPYPAVETVSFSINEYRDDEDGRHYKCICLDDDVELYGRTLHRGEGSGLPEEAYQAAEDALALFRKDDLIRWYDGYAWEDRVDIEIRKRA